MRVGVSCIALARLGLVFRFAVSTWTFGLGFVVLRLFWLWRGLDSCGCVCVVIMILPGLVLLRCICWVVRFGLGWLLGWLVGCWLFASGLLVV